MYVIQASFERLSLNANFFGDVCNVVKKEMCSTRIGQSSMTNLGPISTVRGRETSNGMGTFSIHLQIRHDGRRTWEAIGTNSRKSSAQQ
ncbi:hypothetical protein AVEN_126831-1 [Araneus ventricosus]|uniref:Uncharacterized protein n=1 Tax=Araneus ventricosus TaxID=182803 RepID=A0A4Y2HSV9_ARAVE|nr:hypothetical protein AVEN_126831-1 [Araneus ventricosus]